MQIVSNKLKPSSTSIYLISRAFDRTMREFYKDSKNKEAFENGRKKGGKMKAILILNIVVLLLALVFCSVFFFGWLKAEKKLAKHGESKFFIKK